MKTPQFNLSGQMVLDNTIVTMRNRHRTLLEEAPIERKIRVFREAGQTSISDN
jgi:hypothetical protein